MQSRRILLIIGGGIAAYKALLLIRLLAKRGHKVRAVLTPAAAEFVTALSVGSLTGDKVYQDLFSLTDEAEMGFTYDTLEAYLRNGPSAVDAAVAERIEQLRRVSEHKRAMPPIGPT